MAAMNPANKNNPETAPVTAVQSAPAGASGSVSSPQTRRAAKAAPWTHIVRGESEAITTTAAPSSPSSTVEQAAAAGSFSSSSSSQSNSPSPTPVEESVGEGSENGSGPKGNAGKKPAWNKPSNGAIEVGPVMGAVSWPALSDARASSTKSSTESLKGVSDSPLSISVPQGAAITTISSPKQVSSSTPTHSGPTRQRSMKQRNNASVSSNGGVPQHLTPTGQGVEVTANNPSPKEPNHRSAFGSQTQTSNDHPQQRNSFRNRNGGPHPRGDGTHHHNYGGRHQDRGSQDWNNHRNFTNRDNHMHPQRVAPRGIRPTHQAPAPPPAFIPQPIRPYPGHLGFDIQGPLQVPLLYIHPGQDPLVPFMAPPRPPLIFAGPDLQLHTKIINQIDYYFSNENLIKDTFLRRNMDDQGWVRIKLIAGFNKVMNLTDNIQIILDALRMSTVVEVQGDKIRRRNDWMKWVMPAAQPPTVSSSQTLGKPGNDMLSAHIQSISLDEMTANSNNSQQQLSSGDGAGQ